MNPQIDALSIAGAQSQLVIGGPFTLQVLLDTTLTAGTLTMLPGGILATGTYTQTGGLLQYLLAPSGGGRIEVVNTATLGDAALAAFARSRDVGVGAVAVRSPYRLAAHRRACPYSSSSKEGSEFVLRLLRANPRNWSNQQLRSLRCTQPRPP